MLSYLDLYKKTHTADELLMLTATRQLAENKRLETGETCFPKTWLYSKIKHLRLKLRSSHCVPQITVEKILEHVTWRVLEGSCWVGELFNGDSLKTHNY